MSVLVVDDEAPARRQVARFLREDPRFKIVGEALTLRWCSRRASVWLVLEPTEIVRLVAANKRRPIHLREGEHLVRMSLIELADATAGERATHRPAAVEAGSRLRHARPP